MLEGRIVAYLAVLRAPRIRRLRILMAGGKVFTSTTRCWLSSDASGSPFGTGNSYLFNDGGSAFSPLVRTGKATTVGLTYRWSAGATARETDLFTAAHPAPVHITIAVLGGLALTVRKTIEPLMQSPALPVAPAVSMTPGVPMTPLVQAHRGTHVPSKLDYLAFASFADFSSVLSMSSYRTDVPPPAVK